MKKTLFVFLATLFTGVSILAQSIQEGIAHLYADRFKSAENTFQKMLAVNPNQIEAVYWLGQTYLDMDVNASARQAYEKALLANGNAPLLLVGMGHVELLEGKTNEARQRFETALTMSRTRKGDDPVILNAIGRANVDAKLGDLPYAIEKLEQAVQKDAKNPEIYLNLGNAYRKANPGQGGGQAYTNYQKALQVSPNFAVAHIRIAKLFETQKNWDLVLQNLNAAVTKDPSFTLGYYELFYYYFFRQDFTQAEQYLNKYIQSKGAERDVQDEYLYAQLCWAKKDFICAITRAGSVVSAMGPSTKPKVYKLLAYSHVDKGDTTGAKQYIDQYFAREKPEDIIPGDLLLKGMIYGATTGDENIVFESYVKAAALDTTVAERLETLKKGAEFFKSKGNRLKEAEMRVKILQSKDDPNQRDIFDAGLAYYMGKDYVKADSLFTLYTVKFPDEIFGWQWKFNSLRVVDSTKEHGMAVPAALKYLEHLEKDTAKYKTTIFGVAGYLAEYYANIAKDKDKAIEYLKKMLLMDPANPDIQKNIDILQKSRNTNAPRSTSRPVGKSASKTAQGSSPPIP